MFIVFGKTGIQEYENTRRYYCLVSLSPCLLVFFIILSLSHEGYCFSCVVKV